MLSESVYIQGSLFGERKLTVLLHKFRLLGLILKGVDIVPHFFKGVKETFLHELSHFLHYTKGTMASVYVTIALHSILALAIANRTIDSSCRLVI